MNTVFKDLKDKMETFGREVETIQKKKKRKQMEILELKDVIN